MLEEKDNKWYSSTSEKESSIMRYGPCLAQNVKAAMLLVIVIEKTGENILIATSWRK